MRPFARREGYLAVPRLHVGILSAASFASGAWSRRIDGASDPMASRELGPVEVRKTSYSSDGRSHKLRVIRDLRSRERFREV